MKKKTALVLGVAILCSITFAWGYASGKKRGIDEGQKVLGFDIKYPGPNCPKDCGQYISTGYRAFAIDSGLHYIVTYVPQK